MTVMLIWIVTLPIGYAIVAPYYPDEPLSWRELIGMALMVAIWPIVVIMLLIEQEDK